MPSKFTFSGLTDFIENRMRMSHIYQPLLIKTLVEAGGTATLRQLASAFLLQDESQLDFYETRINEMPVRVLKKHGVVNKEGELIMLNVEALSYEQKAKVKMLCEKRLQSYLAKRGMSTWDYRMLETDPVSESTRYQVLKEANGRCALCGATSKERPLDVDHIIPRSRGGNNEYENLQVLCSKCNRSKGNKDNTSFKIAKDDRKMSCSFCYQNVSCQIEAENNSVFAILDGYPVANGHHLILTKRHVKDFFSMTAVEHEDATALIRVLRKKLTSQDKSITGFNVGVNCGESAGQTIFHVHIHLIPRRNGDTPNPRGGVRGAIPDKMDYNQ